jgi:O-antigen/teichoic acid export membrane protein
MFIAGLVLLAALLWYFPERAENLVIAIIGTFAFVFGLFSILMGYFQREESLQSAGTTLDTADRYSTQERKK